MPINPLRPMPYGHDHAILAEHQIRIEMGFNLFERVTLNPT